MASAIIGHLDPLNPWTLGHFVELVVVFTWQSGDMRGPTFSWWVGGMGHVSGGAGSLAGLGTSMGADNRDHAEIPFRRSVLNRSMQCMAAKGAPKGAQVL